MKPSLRWSHGSATGLSIEIRPSRSLRILGASSLLLPIPGVLILLAPHPPLPTFSLMVILFVTPVWAFLVPWMTRGMAGAYSLATTQDGVHWASTLRATGTVEFWTLQNYYSTPWLVVLYLRSEHGRRKASLVLPRDALTAKTHRRLRAMLALMQERGGPATSSP